MKHKFNINWIIYDEMFSVIHLDFYSQFELFG